MAAQPTGSPKWESSEESALGLLGHCGPNSVLASGDRIDIADNID